ncbi:hypothetical protein D3C85_1581430 [compost metagenome]
MQFVCAILSRAMYMSFSAVESQGRSGRLDVQCYIDVAAYGFGVGADVVCGIGDGARDFLIKPRQAHIETRLEKVGIAGLTQIDFDPDTGIGW